MSLPPTTSKVTGDANDLVTFKYRFPNFTGTHTGTTISLGVNSIAGGGTGAATKAAGFDALSPMSASGDIIYGGASGTGTRLAAGTNGQVLSLASGVPSWINASSTGAVVASYGATTGNSPSSGSPLNYDTVLIDTYSAVSVGSNWKFTAPVTGYYMIGGTDYNSSGANVEIDLWKNGSVYCVIGNTNASGIYQLANIIIPLTAGDYIDLRPSGGSITMQGFANSKYYCTVNISLIPGIPGGLEVINARYYASATSISGSLATVVWSTQDFDSNAAMSSGVYTIPVTGKYQVNSAIAVSGTIALNNTVDMQLQVNGTAVSRDLQYAGGAITQFFAGLSDIIKCNSGDTVRVQVSSSAILPTLVSSNTLNYFSISKVG